MSTLLRLLVPSVCLIPVLGAATAAIPLGFEQRDPALFAARSGGVPIQIRRDRLTLGGVTLRFLRASEHARMEGIGASSPATYIDRNSARTFRQYPKLAIRGIYRGVDAIFYGDSGRLEYDLELAGGASVNDLRLAFDGARRLRLRADGCLVVETAAGELRQMPPRVLQGDKRVASRYVLLSHNHVGFRLGSHDPGRGLTIDPVLVYEKYFGGSGSDTTKSVATDAQGNVYVAGQSNSMDFPSAGGFGTPPTPPLIALTNGGKTITPLPVGQETGVTAVGGTPDGAILYAAAGTTIYYSSNGGGSWRKTSPLPIPIFGVVQSPPFVTAISVDAIDPSRAYISTTKGLYSTADNGGSWFPRDYGLAANFDSSIFGTNVTVSPVDHTILYATTGQPNFLYKSTDAAGTWHVLNPLYPGEPAPTLYSTGQIFFQLAPNGNDLYAVNADNFLLKSTDGGTTWQKLAEGLFGVKAIHIDPSNPSNLIVRDNFGIQVSSDGGLTFTTELPQGVQGQSVGASAYDPSTGTLYIWASNGLYVSPDRGVTWQPIALTLGFNVHSMNAFGGRVFVALDTPQTTFLVKFDSSGSRLLYSTFFNGKPLDNVIGLAVDPQGNAYLGATTFSQSFEGATQLGKPSPGQMISTVVGKVTSDGTALAYLAVLGGAKGVFATALAVDSTGEVYLTGQTSSPDFPTSVNAFQATPPAAKCTRPQDILFFRTDLQAYAYVSKIAPDGKSLAYSTYLTGACGSLGDAIAVNAAGEAFVGGYTTSTDMPVSPNAYQGTFPGLTDKTGYPNPLTAGFAARLSAAGDKVLGGTYIGGSYLSQVTAIALDRSGNPVLTGSTWGISAGATPGAYQTKVTYQCAEPISIGPSVPPSNGADAFVLKLDTAFANAAFLTYLGGACYDTGSAIALDPSGNIWLAGITNSADFPLNGTLESPPLGSAYISELTGDGSKLLFSSYSDGNSLAIDPTGFVYFTGSTTLPVIPKRTTLTQPYTAVLVKIDPTATAPVVINSVGNLSITNTTPQPVFNAGAVAPGELIRIDGHNLGPATKVDAQMDSNGRLPFLVAGTKVQFDSMPAPLISVQESEIVCFVPFAVKDFAQLTVQASGQNSNSVRVTVNPVVAEVLSVLNQDGTPNSASNPAAPGSVVTLYVSGLGQTSPPSIDGTVNTPPLAVPLSTPVVFFNGQQIQPQFLAAAEGLIAGISQMNILIPPGSYTGNVFGFSLPGGFTQIYIAK